MRTSGTLKPSIRDLLLFASVTAIHLLSTVGLLVYVFGAGMARFDSGIPAGLTETVAEWLLAALSLPVLTVLDRLRVLRVPGLWGYLPFLANSSLWGLVVVAARRRLRTSASRYRQTHRDTAADQTWSL